jgi:hypothetical protein
LWLLSSWKAIHLTQYLLPTRQLHPFTHYLHIKADILDQTSSASYGIAVCMMWLRTLSFMLMEKHLGQVWAVIAFPEVWPPVLTCLSLQFVRVMLNMAKDLGFFSVVWLVLTLGFGAAMHGALHRDDHWGDDNLSQGGGSSPVKSCENRLPMQQWSSWWLIRTYLQSLGEVTLHLNSDWKSRLIMWLYE